MWIATARMKACHFEARRIELGGGKSNASASSSKATSNQPATPSVPSACSAKNAAVANAAMDEIDARLGTFLDSPRGRNATVATPTLQVIMWATQKMSETIWRYCPNSVGYAERLSELQASYDAALDACQKIRTNESVCGPVAP
ncbi:hypothetical protein V3390_04395 [Luteimonas sp. FXH3W]|uniref:Uncharacterized protein n=1 Tax=Aquilutibacter rugosus TaxID=3115820 RepID=A0ABU7UY40_9GAMM